MLKKIGSTIIENLKEKVDLSLEKYKNIEKYFNEIEVIPDILLCTGLLHDMGNPPFGHFGEEIIRNWFRVNLAREDLKFKGKQIKTLLNEQQIADLLYFEGNAQVLRVILKLYNNDNGYGMNLTKAVISSLIKYPVPSTDIDDKKIKKNGYFYAEENIVKEISIKVGTHDGTRFLKHPLAYVLEAADDIAYATADVEDAFKKGILSFEDIITLLDKYLKEIYVQYHISKEEQSYSMSLIKNLKKCRSNKLEEKEVIINQHLMLMRDWLIYCAAYGFTNHYTKIMDGSFKGSLFEGTRQFPTIKALKNIAVCHIFIDKNIMTIEISAVQILCFLLNKFIQAVLQYDFQKESSKNETGKLIHLLPKSYIENYKKETKLLPEEDTVYYRILLVTDFVCGMTDSYAKRLYLDLNGYRDM